MNKTHNLFKLSSIALLALGLFTFSSCGGDDDDDNVINTQKDFAEQYFNVDNGTYHNSAMPSSTTNQTISGISISSQDGSATIDISSDVEYDRFYVGVEGTPGYMEYDPASTRAGRFSYKIPVKFGTKAPSTMKIQVKGRTKSGDITSAYSQSIQTFGGDIGTNNIDKVKGKWRYEYEQEDDMGTVREDYTFQGFGTSKVADYSLEEYETEDAWRIQVEGQYKLQGSTLRLYVRRIRDKSWGGQWSQWKDKGYAGSLMSYYINWQSTYSSWNEYVEQGEGDVWECLINDAKTEMQWRKLKAVYKYDPVSGESSVSYTYDTAYPTRQLKKI